MRKFALELMQFSLESHGAVIHTDTLIRRSKIAHYVQRLRNEKVALHNFKIAIRAFFGQLKLFIHFKKNFHFAQIGSS